MPKPRLVTIGPSHGGLCIDAAGARKSEARILEVFDEVEARLDRGGRYLVGDAFTAADLTFAALAAPVVVPPEYGWPLLAFDQSPPERLEGLERFRSRKAGRFALQIYRDERRTSVVA